jgi:predicted amidohydrolase YtcJ
MPATLVIENAAVLTMDEMRPRAEAVAVVGHEIAALGSNGDIAAWKGAGTEVIDARGATVLPGFIEAHMHLFAGAAELANADLTGVSGAEALAAAIKVHAARNPADKLLVANQADYTILGEGRRVTRQDLDAIIPDRPFMMYAPDHHTAWANTIALEKAGVLKGRALGPGNEIVMGADGLAAGELREGEAMEPVGALKADGGRATLGLRTGGEPETPPTPGERAQDRAILRRGLEHCARHGITSIHNMDGNLYTLELLEEIEAEGGLTARVEVPFHFKNFMETSALEKASAMAKRYRSETLKSGRVKLFIDGVLDGWTAVMLDDYANKPGWKGEPLFEPKRFNDICIEADRRGLQISVHAIGDGAVRIVLDAYEAARKANGARDSRHRIEHIEVIHPDDIPRFAELGVIASMQPVHPPGCAGLPLEPTVSAIGEAKWPYAYAWNTLRAAGARLAFATDWPVSPIDPLNCIYWAMNRDVWKPGLPEQRQTLRQALAGYTSDGAYTEFAERRKGVLKPGMLADLAVLSGNIERASPAGLKTAHTVCGGRLVFSA